MNVTPVIIRELRAEARRAMNAWLRVAGAGVLLALLALLSVQMTGLAVGHGSRVFNQLNLTLFAAIWLVAPLLTADCISSERREGTLGLLFLTPLKPRDIVLAKSLVHALRALSLMLAAFPVLAVPLLVGGVTWMDLTRAALLDFGALTLALTTGLLASCWCREWSRATLLALGLSLASGFLFVSLHAAYRAWQWVGMSNRALFTKLFFERFFNYLESRLIQFPLFQLGQDVPFYFIWRGRGAGGADVRAVWLAGALLLFALLLGLLVIWLATRRIRTAWKEQPPTKRQQWWLGVFCTPALSRGLFRRYRRAALERNPIGWLQGYSWSARLSKWGWCLGLVLAECALFAGTIWGTYVEIQKLLGYALALGIALSASASFRKERQTGAMELILVTPLRVRQIIVGRLLGLWSQFLPSVGILIGIWLYLVESRQAVWRGWWGGDPTRYDFPVWLVMTFLTLPVVGLYFSLKNRHIIVNWLLTCVVGIMGPFFLAATVSFFGRMSWTAVLFGPLFVAVCQLGLAAVIGEQLARDLARRSFVRQRATSA